MLLASHEIEVRSTQEVCHSEARQYRARNLLSVSNEILVVDYFRPGCNSAPVSNMLYGHAFFFTVTCSAGAAGFPAAGATGSSFATTFQSAGGFAIPQTFPWVYSAAPIRNSLPSFPSGTQLATRPVTLPPPGSPLSMIGVSICSSSVLRNPHPCALTTSSVHLSPNGRLRSRLITLTGISTRTRVLRRTAFDVVTSIEHTPRRRICSSGPHLYSCRIHTSPRMTKVTY